MTITTWFFALGTIGVLGLAAHALATGRAAAPGAPARRSAQPFRYWGRLLVMLAFAGCGGLLWHRSLTADPDPGLVAAAAVLPWLIFSLADALRSGEVSLLSRTPTRRAERPVPYWTMVGFMLSLTVFFGWVVVRSLA